MEIAMIDKARSVIFAAAAVGLLAGCSQAEPTETISEDQAVRNVVLVHGAFVDGSGWRGVYDILTARGYGVSIVQNPLTSLEDDVAATMRVLESQSGPAILVGHSWGGTVITEAGVHPNVAGLVYVSALAPDAGETTAGQYEGYPAASDFVIDVSEDGFGIVRPDRFQSGFAADLNDADAAFLRDSQLPIRMSAFESKLENAAWRSKPSWAVIASEDRAFGEGMLLGMAQRIDAEIVDIPGSHAAFITQAAAVADVIDRAARHVSNRTQDHASSQAATSGLSLPPIIGAAKAAEPLKAGEKIMTYVTTRDGVEIFYKDWGPKDAQPIVFHHGWPLSSDDWDAQLTFFVNQGYRVVAHDRRGHGRSAQVSDGHDMDHYAADVEAVVEALDLRNAVHIGHSTGGGEVARYVARAKPGRVAKAVLIGAVPPIMLKTADYPGGLPIEVFDGFRAALAADRSSFYRDVASGPFYGFNREGVEARPAVVDNWWRQGMMGGAKAHYDGIKAFSETDFTEDLKAIDVPTLVMHGDDDQIVPIDASAKLAVKLLKKGELKIYPGFSHGMATVNADVINRDLLAFIKG
ncbi:MAG TPA: hypothetical protein DCF73_12510 [Rhodobiaceae bacterium]|nr:hypothetical protein [Rhodobiaceae bacterium]